MTYPHRLVPPRRAALVDEKNDILRRMRAVPKGQKLHAYYRMLVKNLQAVDGELSRITTERLNNHSKSFEACFIKAAKSMLTQEQWRELSDIAERMVLDEQASTD